MTVKVHCLFSTGISATMRNSVYLWLCLIAFLPFTTVCAQPPKPNVIYMMVDDLGPGDYSSYDNLDGLGATSRIATPNLDQLAAEAMRFTHAHSATTLCAPTRAAIMAGTATWRTNIRWGLGSSSLRSGQQGVGDLMKQGGYKTALVGKGHLGGQIYQVGSNNATGSSYGNLPNMDLDRPLKDGFKEHGYDYTLYLSGGIQQAPYVFWEDDLAATIDAFGNSTRITNANKLDTSVTRQWPGGFDDGVTETFPSGWGAVDWKTRDVPQAMMQKSINFINDTLSTSPNDPFFLHYNSVVGHWPYVPADTFEVDLNNDGDRTDPGESYVIDGYDGTGPAPDDKGTESMQMVSMSDAEVGSLMQYLEQTDDPRNPGHKLIDNTMFIYASDNGGIGRNYTNQFGPFDREEWDVYGHDSTAGLRENKGYYTEGGHRIPFLVKWEGKVPEGTVRNQLVSNVDLMATLAGVSGQSLIDQGQDSHNLMPVFLGDRDDSDPVRDRLVVEDLGAAADGNTSRYLYLADGWKLELGLNSSNPTVHGFYHLANDPAETVDLKNSPDTMIQSRLSNMYDEFLAERNSVRMAPAFIGSEASAAVSDVAGYGDVEVEGVLAGQGLINGDLDANRNAIVRILPGSGTGASQTINVSEDIRLDVDGAQYNTGWRISVGNDRNGDLQRSAIEFDLTSLNLPAGATVTDVELVLTVGFDWADAENDSPTIEIYPLTTQFEESSATWNLARSGVPWITPGGDYDDTKLLGTVDGFDPATVAGGDQLIINDTALTADIIANLSNSEYQLMVKYDDASEASSIINAMWINSLQLGSPVTQLIVDYDVPGFDRQLSVGGDYTQREGSTLEIDLSSAIEYDRLDVSGDVVLLGGDLTILLDTGFAPALGDSFDILDFTTLTGNFDNIEYPSLSPGLAWDDSALLTTGEISVVASLLGDFDFDGDVDSVDFLKWQRGESPTPYSQADLSDWQTNYGTGGLSGPSSTQIPEPSTFLLWAVAICALSITRRASK